MCLSNNYYIEFVSGVEEANDSWEGGGLNRTTEGKFEHDWQNRFGKLKYAKSPEIN